jgi:hypothetical protein
MPEINPSEEIHNLEMLTKLNTESLGEDIKCSYFHPSEENKVLTVVDGNFAVWDIKEAGKICEASKIRTIFKIWTLIKLLFSLCLREPSMAKVNQNFQQQSGTHTKARVIWQQQMILSLEGGTHGQAKRLGQ